MSDWYYAINNEQKGPINESELKADLAQKKIPADTLVWKEGMDNWSPANTVAAFSFRPPPIPARTQPPVTSTPASRAPETKADAPTSGPVNNPDSTKPVDLSDILQKPEALEVAADDAETNKMFGIMAYVGPLFLVPLLTVKDSPYAKYHANQGFVLCLVEILISVLHWFVTIFNLWYPIVLLVSILWLPAVGLAVWGAVNAGYGKCVPLPLIGGIKLVK